METTEHELKQAMNRTDELYREPESIQADRNVIQSELDDLKAIFRRVLTDRLELLKALKLCLPLVQNDVYELGSDSTCFYCGMEIDSGDEHKNDCPQLVAYLAAKAAITRAEGK